MMIQIIAVNTNDLLKFEAAGHHLAIFNSRMDLNRLRYNQAE